MKTTPQTVDDQSTLWNGIAGNAWVEAQPLLDQIYRPFETLLVDSINSEAADCVLDVGCGTGSTTLAASRATTMKYCCGIDISEPMISAARNRAVRAQSPTTFVHGNAETFDFSPASFNAIISRFGVMFFDDSVRAFANLRKAATNGALLQFIAWRDAAENPFMTTAERAAAPMLPTVPTRQADAPGQFAFADRSKVSRILEESGWVHIDFRPVDVPCVFPESDLIAYFTRLGPLGRFLNQTDERLRSQIVQTVRAAFAPFVHGDEVRFVAACWSVTARASRVSNKDPL